MSNRLLPEQRRWVIKQLTMGTPYPKIQELIQTKFHRTINALTLTRISKASIDAITQGRALIAQDGAVSAAMLKTKTHQLLEAQLDDAIEDMGELRKLRLQLRNGEITEAGYRSKVELYQRLTISELVKASEAMHNQARGEGDKDPMTPNDQAAFAALLTGIQSGDTINLIQILKGSSGSLAA